MKNPIEKRLQTEAVKRIAETFLGKKNFSWCAIIYACMTFIVAGWLPDGIVELLKKEWIGGGYKTIVSLAILLFIGFRLKKAIKYKGKIEVKSETLSPVKVLAVFLSPLYRKLKSNDIEQALTNKTFSKDTLTGTEWEMVIRAIEHHSEKLKVLYVLTSQMTSPLIPLFKQVVNKLFLSIEVREFKDRGIEFQDIKEVFESVEELYNRVKEEGYKEEEIIVDVTGGQVTNSIAGAIATLTFGRKFQYVSTRDKKVISYDIGYFEEEQE